MRKLFKRLLKTFELKNCLSWALKKEKRHGGYIVSRKTRRRGLWKKLKGRHFLWMPAICPDHDKPCPYMEHYSPEADLPDWQLPISFEGIVLQGDHPPEEKEKESDSTV